MEELNKRSFDDRQYHFEAKFDLDGETPPPEVIPEAQNQIVVGILVGLIVILSVLFASMLLPCVLRCFRQRIPVSDKRIERRYETIEGWMISKKVQAHCEGCERIQRTLKAAKDADGVPLPIKLAASYDTAETQAIEVWEDDDDENECPICMEAFQVDEIVSWSPNVTCSHCFHHECIKEWLLHNGNCPFCREVYLPIDEHPQLIEKEVLRELAKKRSQRLASTYFCRQEGLISVHRSVSSDKDFLDSVDKLTRPCLKKGELIKLRGSRLEETTADEGDGPSTQILQPEVATEGPISAAFEVVLTSTSADERGMSSSESSEDSDEEMGNARARSIFRAEDEDPASNAPAVVQ